MRKKTVRYADNPELPDIKDLKIVSDFLPSAELLAHAEEVTVVKIPLSRKSMDFFKRRAKQKREQLQTTIRRLLDEYAGRYA